MTNSHSYVAKLRIYIYAAIAFAFLFIVEAPPQAHADENSFSLKQIMMPGPVILGHADIEKECDQCHGDDRIKLCRDCHDKVDADITAGEGFHGRMSPSKQVECIVCHSDHLGRNADILNLDQDSFDHSKTDFVLENKHASTPCAGCHQEDELYREAPHDCFSCHEKDDHHQGTLGESCNDCHSTKNWVESEFDHDDTEFPLHGSHQEVSCNACHPDQKYKDTPTNCYSCHALNDIHNGVNGSDCSQCHQETKWDKLTFDHDKDTNFKLQGGHKNLTCNACHTKTDHKDELDTKCISCHKNDDKHLGRNGDECDSCHTIETWRKQTFDHNLDTDFELHGRHTEITCESCHGTDTKDEQLSSACNHCHKQDDVHDGQEGTLCQECHNPEGWLVDVRFDHNLTAFPLVGIHAITNCDACHLTKEFRFIKQQCSECHQADDIHKGGLGTECAYCHTPNDWSLWQFDHDKQTDFILDGAHKDLTCSDCHYKPIAGQVEQNSACIACHADDDEHNRRFGRACERCHNTEAFDKISELSQ